MPRAKKPAAQPPSRPEKPDSSPRPALHDSYQRSMDVAWVPIGSLKPHPKNSRKHDDKQVKLLGSSLDEFGVMRPILVDEADTILAGHGLWMAAQSKGLAEVPIIRHSHLTETQKRAYIIADNKLAMLSAWDDDILRIELGELKTVGFDLSVVGFGDLEVIRFLNQPAGFQGDTITVPEPPRHPSSVLGDIWLLGDHRVMCGDSTKHVDVRKLMNGQRAILFATDPPYLVDYNGNNHPTRNKDWTESYGVTWDDSSQGAELYDGFIKAAVDEAISENAAWYCWHASRRQAMLEACWERAGAFVHQQIIWVKDRGVLTRSHYLWKHEPCFMGWIRTKRPPKVSSDTLATTWELPSFSKSDRPDHPTPKPIECFGIPMVQHVEPGGLCYEPFSGSGSQVIAGESHGRRVYAMEISPAYVDVTVQRWQAFTGKNATHEGSGMEFDRVAAARAAAAPKARKPRARKPAPAPAQAAP